VLSENKLEAGMCITAVQRAIGCSLTVYRRTSISAGWCLKRSISFWETNKLSPADDKIVRLRRLRGRIFKPQPR